MDNYKKGLFSKRNFINYLYSRGYNHITDGGTQSNGWQKRTVLEVPETFSCFGPTDVCLTINGDDSTKIRWGISEGIVLDPHPSLRDPLPFKGDSFHFRNREVVDWVFKNYPAEEIYKAMFGDKLNINVWDKNIK